jgi:hypothetical protein
MTQGNLRIPLIRDPVPILLTGAPVSRGLSRLCRIHPLPTASQLGGLAGRLTLQATQAMVVALWVPHR